MVARSSIQSPQEFGSAGGGVDGDAAGIEQPETSSGGDSGTIDPSKIAGPGPGPFASGAEESGPKKRGRKPGWKKPPETKQTNALDIPSLNKLIYNGHLLLAKAAKIPELQLDEEEATKLAEAAVNVARHYNIAVSQKTMDWSNFGIALSAIYGTRIAAIVANKRLDKMPKANSQKPQPQTNTAPIKSPFADALKPNVEPFLKPVNPYDIGAMGNA